MEEPIILSQEEIAELLERAVKDRAEGDMTYITHGKWHKAKCTFTALTDETLHIDIIRPENTHPETIQINQPIGVSVQMDYFKFIFETILVGFEPAILLSDGGRAILEIPEKVEKMQRRAFVRVDVPSDLNVKTLFWHRGYTDDSTEVPMENYWQGRLVNLSAGGAQITLEPEFRDNFKEHQVVGMQFTPMSYQRPILVEAQVVHVAEACEDGTFSIGVEFLGLEAGGQGREILHRIHEIVTEYEHQNNPDAQHAH